MPRVSTIEVAPTEAAMAERHALALAVIARYAADARDAGRDRFDVHAAWCAYITKHGERFNQGREARTVDPDPRPMQGDVFRDLAAEHLGGCVSVAGVVTYLLLPA
ncbi:hypothetical protein OG836_26180 [Micromonospora zamorensis]|uniref:hypothetical protein n=1 Tax=Micromonospora zamorensis TaxID=709883 RepID=UPI002E1F803B